MIKDFRLGIRMLKYAHAVKSSMIIAGVMIIVGGFMTAINFVSGDVAGFPGGYFTMLSSLFLVQMLSSVSISNLAQTSPARKRLQTSVPTVMNLVFMSIAFLITVAEEYVCILLKPEETQRIAEQLLFTAVIMGVVILYTAVAYKLFVLGTVFFVALFVPSYAFLLTGSGRVRLWESNGLFLQISLLGFAIIVLSCLLQYGISLALYRLPLSKRAQAATLRKQL